MILKMSDPKEAFKDLSTSCEYGDPFGCLELASLAGAAGTASTTHDLYRKACWWGEEEGCKLLDSHEYELVKEQERVNDERKGDVERWSARDHLPPPDMPDHAPEHPVIP
jgi:hypothetical protein